MVVYKNIKTHLIIVILLIFAMFLVQGCQENETTGEMIDKEQNILINLNTEIERAFKEVLENGSMVKKYNFTVPKETVKVCFMDENERRTGNIHKHGLCKDDHDDHDAQICEMWRYEKQNVGFSPPIRIPINVKDIIVRNEEENVTKPYICTEVIDGNLGIVLTGKDGGVKVSELN